MESVKLMRAGESFLDLRRVIWAYDRSASPHTERDGFEIGYECSGRQIVALDISQQMFADLKQLDGDLLWFGKVAFKPYSRQGNVCGLVVMCLLAGGENGPATLMLDAPNISPANPPPTFRLDQDSEQAIRKALSSDDSPLLHQYPWIKDDEP